MLDLHLNVNPNIWATARASSKFVVGNSVLKNLLIDGIVEVKYENDSIKYQLKYEIPKQLDLTFEYDQVIFNKDGLCTAYSIPKRTGSLDLKITDPWETISYGTPSNTKPLSNLSDEVLGKDILERLFTKDNLRKIFKLMNTSANSAVCLYNNVKQ